MNLLNEFKLIILMPRILGVLKLLVLGGTPSFFELTTPLLTGLIYYRS